MKANPCRHLDQRLRHSQFSTQRMLPKRGEVGAAPMTGRASSFWQYPRSIGMGCRPVSVACGCGGGRISLESSCGQAGRFFSWTGRGEPENLRGDRVPTYVDLVRHRMA